MFKRRIIILVLMLICLIPESRAFAVNWGSFKDKGRARNYQLSGSTLSNETAVLSTQSSWEYVTSNYIRGNTNIRAFGRLDTVKGVYPSPYYSVFINKFELKYSCTTDNNYKFFIDGHNPPNQSSGTIPTCVWSILDYLNYPYSDLLSSYTNYLLASGVTSTPSTGSSTLTKIFSSGGSFDSSKTSLPNSTSYLSLDYYVSGTKGIAANFGFYIYPVDSGYYTTYSKARVRYMIVPSSTGIPFYIWSGNASKNFTVY